MFRLFSRLIGWNGYQERSAGGWDLVVQARRAGRFPSDIPEGAHGRWLGF